MRQFRALALLQVHARIPHVLAAQGNDRPRQKDLPVVLALIEGSCESQERLAGARGNGPKPTSGDSLIEAPTYYSVMWLRNERVETRNRLKGLSTEFGPAGIVTVGQRPLLPYACPLLVGSIAWGTAIAKVATDLCFYSLVMYMHETHSQHHHGRRCVTDSIGQLMQQAGIVRQPAAQDRAHGMMEGDSHHWLFNLWEGLPTPATLLPGTTPSDKWRPQARSGPNQPLLPGDFTSVSLARHTRLLGSHP